MSWSDMDGWTDHLKDVWVNSLLPVIGFFWIWVVTFLFFFKGIDVQATNVSIFKIVYTSFALICIISFQFSRDFWQKMIVRFWTFVIIYAVFVFIAIFLFQITSIRTFCYNIGLTQKWQQDIGLPVFDMTELLLFLTLESLIIVMVVMLQLLLHKAPPIPSIPFESVEKLVEILDTFFDITKLTVFGIIMTCIAKVNAIHFCFVIAAVFSMVLKRTIRYVIIQLISVCAAILLVSQMVMQLHFFSDVKNVICIVKSSKENVTLSNGAWLGFGKIESGESLLFNVTGYICIIALVTLYTVIVKERSIIQGLRQEAGWNPYKMFSDTAYLNADKDFSSYLKYLLKYGFYRYGTELTLICIAMLIQARLDVWALVYSIWLVIFVLCHHSLLAITWPFFKYFVLVSIPLQYAAALGFWPEKCFGYQLEKNEIFKNAFDWLYLPIGSTKPDAFKLFWDSLVFLFALCQANVFDFERKHANDDFAKISPPITSHSNPDTVIHPTTTFGLIRYAIFCSFPIVSAIAFFFAATSGITLFSIGYGIGFMLILWFADNYFLRPTLQTIHFWKYLLIFNVITILVKTALQIPGCVFMHYLVEHSCWIVQLLGITCLKLSTKTIAFFKVPIISTADIPENSCWYLPTSVGIEWDVFCFISLMFHKRFLRSIYFSEMSKEAVLDVKFSYRAAKILEELNKQEMREMREKYKKNMEKIQKTMARLKEAQKRIRGLKIAEPLTHQEAVTSGDYYMFDDTDKGVKLSTEAEEDEEASKAKDECGMSPSTPNVGKLMEAVMKTDIEQALKIAESASSSSDKSSISSFTGSKKCYECNCKTREAAEITIAEQEKQEKQITLAKQEKPIKEKKVLPSIIVKDEKLLPTVNFDRRKSLKTSKPQMKSSKVPEEKNKSKCLCGCENCKCPLRFLTKTCNTICLTIRFAIAFINGCMISLCQIFNEIAYDYKYIRKQLCKEKLQAAHKSIIVSPGPLSDTITVTSEKEKMELSYSVPIYIRLLISFYDVVMSSFNTVCFLTVLLLQMRNPTIFTILLTMMVLLWGSLSVPRPTKRFWKLSLSYTGGLLILEGLLRIQFIQVDMQILNYKYLHVQIFDVDKSDNYSIYYLNVILAVFLQRRILMNIGMWSDESSPKRRGNIIRLFYSSVKNFFRKLIYENYNRIPVDVYTPIFLCDFINIFVFIFGFASITEKTEDGVSRYFSENKIPPAMLLLFITQCLGMFIDRWIYLRKHVLAKLVFQIVQIILIHLCLFLLLPAITFRKFNNMFFPSLWYALKSIYFLLSAYQIRRGYPASVHGHALCQSYSVVNMHLYQFYLIFPFVYELRTVTDWMWTETTLTLTEWIGMEDIFCTVFQLKCWRNYDNKYSYKRGQKITSTVKFILGGGIVLLFFLILLFPLAFFTFGRVAGQVNLPIEMEISFRIGSYDPIFTSYSVDIRSITNKQWKQLNELYLYSPRAVTFLSEYYSDDVGIIYMSNYSQSSWNLNPVFKNELVEQLKSETPPQILTQWRLNRHTENLQQPSDVTGFQSVKLEKTACDSLLEILNDNDTINKFVGVEVAPKFVKVSNLATTYSVDSLMHLYDSATADYSISPYVNVTFQYQKAGDQGWWQALQNYPDGWSAAKAADNIVTGGSSSNKNLIIFTFNDKIFSPGIFSYFSAQGILGLYTTFLISLGFIIRKLCRGRTNQVFLDYLPNVDSILQLLLDIYFVREHKDGKLEEDLYAKLIFLFRSPETLIRWTRMPEESD